MPKNESTYPYIDEFWDWANSLDYDIGEHPDDWIPHYKCFTAGFEAGRIFQQRLTE